MECPASDGHDAGNRDTKSEGDRKHVLEGNRMPPEKQRSSNRAGESDHPCHCALRYDNKPEAADTKPGHYGGRDHLSGRIERREEIEGNAKEDECAEGDIADEEPGGNAPPGTSDAGDRLGACKMHCTKIR